MPEPPRDRRKLGVGPTAELTEPTTGIGFLPRPHPRRVCLDARLRQGRRGEGGFPSSQRIYGASPCTPGPIVLAPLAAGVGDNVPVLMARLDSTLYVREQSHGEIDACQVSRGVSNCRQAATLTGGGSGSSGPLAVF
jgi:hypothetical protein